MSQEKVFLAKRELSLLRNCDSVKRQKIENSYSYLGYKLLWLIKMLVEGRKFPNGKLSSEQHKYYIRDIIEFIRKGDILIMLLQFDSKTAFKVIELMFKG
jgi:hypothetical protein